MIPLIVILVFCLKVLSFILFWNSMSKVVCMCETVCLCVHMITL